MSAFIVYSILALLATSMMFAVVWLTLKFDSYRLAEEVPFKACLARYRQDGKLETDARHGWLEREYRSSGQNIVALRNSAAKIRHSVEWFHNQLLTVAEAATAVGFAGTVDSMIQGAQSPDNIIELLGYGMLTTLFGLMIGVPGTAYNRSTHQLVDRLIEQIDEVIDVLDDRITPNEPTSHKSDGSDLDSGDCDTVVAHLLCDQRSHQNGTNGRPQQTVVVAHLPTHGNDGVERSERSKPNRHGATTKSIPILADREIHTPVNRALQPLEQRGGIS